MTQAFERDVTYLIPMIQHTLKDQGAVFLRFDRPDQADWLKDQLRHTPIGKVLKGLADYYDLSETTWAFVVAHTLAVNQSQGHQARFKLERVLDEATEYREEEALASA